MPLVLHLLNSDGRLSPWVQRITEAFAASSELVTSRIPVGPIDVVVYNDAEYVIPELGMSGFDDVPYYGLFAPKGTPKATLDRYSEALAKVIALPEVHERLTAMGLTVGHMTSDQLAKREHAYSQSWAKIIKASGFQAQ